MSSEQNRCDVCKYKGLVIYPARYTVLPQTMTTPGLGPFSGERVTDITLTQSQYALRALRQGFVYLFYEKGKYGKNYWEVYSVAHDGTLRQEIDADTAQEQTNPKTCSRNGHSELRTRYLVIEQPEKCGTVWLAFSEHKWTQKTRKQYEAETERKKRMQPIKASVWADGKGNDKHTAELNAENLQTLVEYAPEIAWNGKEPVDCIYETSYSLNTKQDGEYKNTRIKQCSTKYPWAVYGSDKALRKKQVKKVMQQARLSGGGSSDTSAGTTPVLMALWDAIGITHELNGFRNDAGSMKQLYAEERALQIDALENIQAAHHAIVAQPQAKVRKGYEYSYTVYWHDMFEKGRRAEKRKKLGVASKAGWGLPRDLTEDEKQQVEAKVEQDIQSMVKKEEARREKAIEEAKAEAESKWENQYKPRVDGEELKNFKKNFEAFEKDVRKLQGKRAQDVEGWLKAPLFIATLSDYDEQDLHDGSAFEAVIAQSITGLASEPTGKKVVTDLLDKIDATDDASIIWRAFASNQESVKEEFKNLLAVVEEHKKTPLDSSETGWAHFTRAVNHLGVYASLRNKMLELQLNAIPASATESLVRHSGVDQLVIAVGEPLFHWLPINKIGDTVGRNLIKATLLMRVGVSKADVIDLIRTESRVNPDLHAGLVFGYKHMRSLGYTAMDAYSQTLQDLAARDGAQILRSKWAAIADTAGDAHSNIGVRMGGILAVIELFNFGLILQQSDKTAEDYALLAATGFSAVAASLMGTTKVMVKLGEDAARTLANLKAITGYLGGAASAIGAVLDAGEAIEKFDRDENAIAYLYTVKAILGFGAASAFTLTALTSSAPLIARIAGKDSIVFLSKVGIGIRGAEASSAALARTAAGRLARKEAARIAARTAMGVAAEQAGVVVSERAALLALGRVVVFLGGWEIAIGITAIQVLIWVIKDDDLQTWLDSCSLGQKPEYKHGQLAKQHKDFEAAMHALGLPMDESPA